MLSGRDLTAERIANMRAAEEAYDIEFLESVIGPFRVFGQAVSPGLERANDERNAP